MRFFLLLALAACGDNLLADGVPLVASHDVAVLAHQDDDLLFMEPDRFEIARAGTGLTSIYITAGNGTDGTDDADKRYAGLREAYSYATGERGWDCGWIDIDGHTAEHCRLEAANLSLVFLAYPDGGEEGQFANSLLHLWEGTIAGADTIAERTTHYDRDSLVDTVTTILRIVQPAQIHTLDIASTHGRDHIDHMIAAAIALLAVARADSAAELRSYRGYNTALEPVNQIDAIYNEVFPSLARYEACFAGCADCGKPCTESSIKAVHVTWLHRRYAVGFRRGARGLLREGAQCLGTAGMVDCDGAPAWHLDPYGELRDDTGTCLTVQPDATAVAGDCAGGPERRFFIDDEGHIWSGVPPAPAPAMDYAHLSCLDGAAVSLCGQDHAPAWDFVPKFASTPKATVLFGASGREVRIGDLTGDGHGDLCAVGASGLYCAPGDGAGSFGAPKRIDDTRAPLAIFPESLAIGDVDGDTHRDACGQARDGSGLVCATAASGFAAKPWSHLFGQDALAATPPSLAIVDEAGAGFACGLASEGVVCQPPAMALDAITLSTWPQPSAVVFPGELDADGAPDWCTGGASGAMCGVAAEAKLSTDGVPWSFSLNGTVDPAPLDAATGALADVDGDGRADLCGIDGTRIACGFAQGRGFGPRATLAPLPAGVTAVALWLGDLDGDGKADACVDAGTTIQCTLSP